MTRNSKKARITGETIREQLERLNAVEAVNNAQLSKTANKVFEERIAAESKQAASAPAESSAAPTEASTTPIKAGATPASAEQSANTTAAPTANAERPAPPRPKAPLEPAIPVPKRRLLFTLDKG